MQIVSINHDARQVQLTGGLKGDRIADQDELEDLVKQGHVSADFIKSDSPELPSFTTAPSEVNLDVTASDPA